MSRPAATRSRQPPPRGRAAPVRPRRSPFRVLLVVVVAVAALLWVGLAATGRRPGRSAPGAPAGGQALAPSLFASGSCAAFPPTRGDRHRTVFLDAGHGGVDPGAVGTTSDGATIYEADATLPVEMDAAAELRAAGFRVVVSRTTDNTVLRLGPADVSDGVLSLVGAHDDVAARDQCANLAGAAALVGIYFDSGASPDDAGSVTTYDADRPFASANLRLADLLQADVLAAMNARGWQIPDDGVGDDASYGSLVPTDAGGAISEGAADYHHLLLLGPAETGYFTTPSQMPGAVIEPLFVTDPFEATLAATPADQQVIASGIATAVERFLAPAPSTTAP